MKKEKKKKPYLGRIPIAPASFDFRDKSQYSRKDKHKKKWPEKPLLFLFNFTIYINL